MFDVLIYTDCAAHESVSGRTGFQFMAESPGVTPTDEEFVKNGGLHAVPTVLGQDEPDVHPPSCIYREHVGRFYLSRGRSTGKTLSGRPGNQLTQAIIASADSDVLPLRPAQLYSCPHWELERVGTKELLPWETPLEIDPDFETAALHAMVADDPWARDVLPMFLTMVEQTTAASRTKLIIKHADQTLVMRWIALASLFLDAAAALRLTFRAFSGNPTGDPLDIVGAHPLLSPSLTVAAAAASNQNLIDLETRTSTDLTASASAVLHANWFLAFDPYEALDAIETSRRWSAVIDAGAAALAAAVACLPQEGMVSFTDQQAAAVALAGLADGDRTDELEAYGEALADAVVSFAAQPGDDILPTVNALWSLNRAGQKALAGTVALALLEWATEPTTAARWMRLHSDGPQHDTRSLDWASNDQRAHAAALVATIIRQADDTDLPALFTLAKGLNTGVRAAALQDGIDRLAERWSRQPGLTSDAYSWLHREFVIERLQRHLADACHRDDRGALHALAAGDWDWLMPPSWHFDPQNPMSVWLGSRVLAKAASEARPRLLAELSPAAPTAAWPLFVNTADDPGFGELIRWVLDHPRLDETLARHVQSVLGNDLQGKPTGRTRDLLSVLSDRGVTGLTASLSSWVEKHRRITQLWAEQRSAVHTSKNLALRDLGEWPNTWLAMHRPSLAAAMIDCNDRQGVKMVTAKVQVEKSLENALLPRLRSGDPTALLGALRLLADGSPEHQRVVSRCLHAIWDSESASDEEARERMRAELPANWAPHLSDFEKNQSKGKVARDLARGARTLFDRNRGGR